MAASGSRAVLPGRSDEAVAVGIGVVAVAVYLGALSTGFTGDDYFILARLKHLGGLADPLAYFAFGFFDYYRPIAFLSHAMDWQIWGAHAFGFHLTNVLLHAANSILVFVLGKRLTDRAGAEVAALLFALHPASHEVVYWMAARFDLLATFFSLVAVLCLRHDRTRLYAIGVVAFALALLSKESALSVLVIAPAYDVIVARRDWRAVGRRLAPLVLVAVAYAILRSQGANLAAAGGTGKLPKVLMMAAALAALVWLARRRSGPAQAAPIAGGPPQGPSAESAPGRWSWIVIAAVLIVGALVLPATSGFAREKLGFVTFAVFYLLSPIVFPPPPAWMFEPTAFSGALGAAIAIVLLLVMRATGRLVRVPAAAFLVVFIAAALLPVSSMTGGTRYLYLAGAGVALLVGVVARTWSPTTQRRALFALGVVLVVSWVQLEVAGRSWRWASRMTSDGLALMSADLEPCRRQDIILLTAPVGIRGTYCNFYWDAFDATTGCPPASFLTVLRVVGQDADVEARDRGDGRLDLRVPRYANQFVASSDLRNFDRKVRFEDRWQIDTPIGRLETLSEESAPDGPTQLFRITLSAEAQRAGLFYYSAGRIHSVR
jgi:hypothetical protein